MTEKIKAAEETLTEEEYESSHSPFLSKTADMVKAVDRATEKTVRGERKD